MYNVRVAEVGDHAFYSVYSSYAFSVFIFLTKSRGPPARYASDRYLTNGAKTVGAGRERSKHEREGDAFAHHGQKEYGRNKRQQNNPPPLLRSRGAGDALEPESTLPGVLQEERNCYCRRRATESELIYSGMPAHRI